MMYRYGRKKGYGLAADLAGRGSRMFSSIAVENYRSFADRAQVNLRPITILLGRNSAGKSSITRLFPLLQQSMVRGTSAPILWNSTSIDFGRIGDVVNRGNPGAGLKLSFELKNHSVSPYGGARYRNREDIFSQLTADLVFTATLLEGPDGKTQYNHIKLQVDNDTIEFFIKSEMVTQISLNGRRFDNKGSWSSVFVGGRRIFPYVVYKYAADKDNAVHDLPDSESAIRHILQSLSPNALKNVEGYSKDVLAFMGSARLKVMPFVPRKSLRDILDGIGATGFGNVEQELIGNLADLLLVTYASQIIESISDSLVPAFETVSYLGPIRARGDRFYREQELAVDKIDDKGENLATYIGSLDNAELASFNEMLSAAFGVVVRSQPSIGHLSIEVARAGDETYDNLADVGFGFSQVLPLVAQLHSERRRRPAYRPYDTTALQITAVEQPELHLHPAFQANLADLFAAAVGSARHRDKRPIIILETHSEALVGRLGELIADKQLAASDVAVHFIEKDETTGKSTIRLSDFDDDGFVENWPVGFFSARR